MPRICLWRASISAHLAAGGKRVPKGGASSPLRAVVPPFTERWLVPLTFDLLQTFLLGFFILDGHNSLNSSLQPHGRHDVSIDGTDWESPC